MSAEQAGVWLAAVGDVLSLTDRHGEQLACAPEAAWARVRPAWADCDVVVANLEYTLPGDEGMVATEPRVIGTEAQVRALAAAGVTAVTLANNHAFDCHRPGFLRVRALLEELGVAAFGAGLNEATATAPAVVTAGGLRIALLGAADKLSGVTQFAAGSEYGVARLETAALVEQVRALRMEVDHVIAVVHWGRERWDLPVPEQVAAGRALIEAGASAVIGHHPHVLQGLAWHDGKPIAYSLGNFVASPVHYDDGDRITWNRTERTGCVLRLRLSGSGVEAVEQVATHCVDGCVTVDESRFGRRRLRKVNALVAGPVGAWRYRWERQRVETLRPVLGYLRWSQLRRIRPRHVIKAVRGLAGR